MVNQLLLLIALCFSTAVDASILRRDRCTFLAEAGRFDDTLSMAEDWGIQESVFLSYNPGIKKGAKLEAGRKYCIQQSAETLARPSPSPSSSSDGIPVSVMARSVDMTRPAPPSPTQDGLTGDYCKNLWLGYSVCIGVNGTLVPSTTRPSNGINTPEPIQPGIVENCDRFYLVQPSEGCDGVASKNGISVSQFIEWNPSVGKNCSALWANANACVSIIGHEPSSTKGDGGIQTPLPTQPDIVGNCKSFHFVKQGENCLEITRRYGISLYEFTRWNPKAGSSCASLWANANACVSVL
ncbi:hypothetical protein CP533_5267 [Ophiocordyceps camponoti-saundersi (nom. inval.)]|nr:hypothetical protein CP533_5267 [Ophiocordyceps camponoti-saundersi (nom. inval.)]